MDIQQSPNQNISLFKVDKFLYIAGLVLLLFVGLFTGLLGIWQYVVFGHKTDWLLRVLHSHGAWIGVIVILFASAKHILGETKKKTYIIGLGLVGSGVVMGFILYSLYATYAWNFIETSLVRIHTHTIFYGTFLVLSISLLKIINASERAMKAVAILYGIALIGVTAGQALFVFEGMSPMIAMTMESAVFVAHLVVIYQLVKFLKKELMPEERVFGIFWAWCFVLIFFLTLVGVAMVVTQIIPTQYLSEHGLYWYRLNKAVEDMHLSPVSWYTSGVAISFGLLALRIPLTVSVFSLAILAIAPFLNLVGRTAKVLSTVLPDAGVSIFGNGAKFGIAVLWLGGQPLKVFIVTFVLIYTIYWIRRRAV